MSEAECVWRAGAILGEGPIWSARESAVYWVDIKRPALHRYSLADGSRRTWLMPAPIGWVIERRSRAGFIAGFRDGFAELMLDPLVINYIGCPEPDLPGNRLNDAKADRLGRIYAGTMDDAESAVSGHLYRLDPTRRWERLDSHYRVSNGPAFSPDGETLYHTDSLEKKIYCFDRLADGGLTHKRVFIDLTAGNEYPDGMCTDIEGGLWVAMWGGSRVCRFFPDGRFDRALKLPVSQVTSCVFAGERLDRLFVTSAAIGVNEPDAGGLFELDPGIVGLPCHAFDG